MKQSIYKILLLFLFYPIFVAADEQDHSIGSIQVVSGKMQRLDEDFMVSIQLRIDRKLKSNEHVILVPTVSDSHGKQVVLPSIFINSRRQQILFDRGFYKEHANAQTLRRNNNEVQTLRYLQNLPYEEWMRNAQLTIDEQSCKCGLPNEQGTVFTAQTTKNFEIPEVLPPMAYAKPSIILDKIREKRGKAFVLFPLDRMTIVPTLAENQQELEKIVKSVETVKNDSNCVISKIKLHGYASPEGLYKRNEVLSKGRTSAIKEYIGTLYSFPEELYDIQSTAENWQGFRSLLLKSNETKRNEMLKIIDKDAKPDEKEALFRSLYPKYFASLINDGFKRLRYTDYTIEYTVRHFRTIEEIEAVYKTKPYNLNINEFARLAKKYKIGSDASIEVFTKAVSLFPNDPVANLNTAIALLQQKNSQGAKSYLDKALDCPEKDLALGVYYLLSNKHEEAHTAFKQAEAEGLREAKEYVKLFY